MLFGEFKASELVVKVRNNLHSLYEEYKLLYGDDVEVMNDVNNEKELEVDTEVDGRQVKFMYWICGRLILPNIEFCLMLLEIFWSCMFPLWHMSQHLALVGVFLIYIGAHYLQGWWRH